jgi:EAL domain-containing protein (putative c-di-GMP-specific phosphodiesterase class I)
VPPVAVNVSAVQLQRDDFVASVASIVAGFEGWSLELEVTESVLARDVDGCAARLRRLTTLGINISIDDFGAGYSSLANLSRLPVNAIKLDRAFVAAMATEKHGHSLVAAIVMMARSLDLATIAEGVETSEQLCAVRMLGCTQVQGFHTGRPMPARAAGALLQRGAHA